MCPFGGCPPLLTLVGRFDPLEATAPLLPVYRLPVET
eukprot:Gb_36120 [translate_table: standard]